MGGLIGNNIEFRFNYIFNSRVFTYFKWDIWSKLGFKKINLAFAKECDF